MKLKHSLSLLTLAVCAAGSSGALAQSDAGTINFTGKIIEATCIVKINGGNDNTVTLNTASVNDFNGAGSTAKETQFTFELTGCKIVPTTTQVWAHFSGSNVSTATDPGGVVGLLKNTATGVNAADKVSLQLKNGLGGTAIVAGGTPTQGIAPNGSQGASQGFSQPNYDQTTLTYAVEYYAHAGLTAGDVASSATYTMVYH